ncbi:MAG: superoxide dismutase [Candidatus Omnitrophota bacterium]
MENQKFYVLPELKFPYNAFEPYISEEQLRLHHDKHHAAYVKNANAILERMDRAREEETDFDTTAMFKELSFHIGGHVLHSLFWEGMAPEGEGGGGEPQGELKKVIDHEYGSFDRFKNLFNQTALRVEGSGWAALTYCQHTRRPIIMQIEKHNVNVYPMFKIIMLLDVWEHGYYVDYKNERAKYIDAFWKIINWEKADMMLEKILKK